MCNDLATFDRIERDELDRLNAKVDENKRSGRVRARRGADRRKLIRLGLSFLVVLALVVTTAAMALCNPPWWVNALADAGIVAAILLGEWVV